MPAHRRRRKITVKKNKIKFKKVFLWIAFLFALLLTLFLLFLTLTKSRWSDGSRFVLTIPMENGDAVVSIFDQHSKNIVSITIPNNVEVTAAHNLGKWKMGSIYKLGQQEDLSGEFVAETILKTFKLPSDAWGEAGAMGFTSGKPGEIISAIFSSYRSNLSLKDKVKIALFALRIQNQDIISVNLSETSGLTLTTLADGEKGYVPRNELSPRVLSYFVDSELVKISPHTIIINGTDSPLIASEVSSVVEILGANVLSVKQTQLIDTDCVVRSKESFVSQTIARVFECKVDGEPQSNFDLEIVLGQKFSKRF